MDAFGGDEESAELRKLLGEVVRTVLAPIAGLLLSYLAGGRL